jgi:hypothetical protein
MKRKSIRRFNEHGGEARALAVTAFVLYRWVLALLLWAAQFMFLPIEQFAQAQATGTTMNTGFSPASMNTSNLPQSTVIYYDKNFVKNLKANTPFLRCTARRELPEQSGNQHRLFMYNTLPANTVQTAEGTVGSGITVSVVNNTSTIGQFADYVNVSDLSLATTIDPALENIQKELAYRLGLTLSTLVRNTADGASAIDASVSGLSKNYNVPFKERHHLWRAVAGGQHCKPFMPARCAAPSTRSSWATH